MNVMADKLKNVILGLFNLELQEKDFDKLLLSSEIGLSPRDLLYLLFEIEERFNIKISEEQIIKGDLKTVNSILSLLST